MQVLRLIYFFGTQDTFSLKKFLAAFKALVFQFNVGKFWNSTLVCPRVQVFVNDSLPSCFVFGQIDRFEIGLC